MAGMAINSSPERTRTLVTHPQYRTFDDVSTRCYGWAVAQPRWLDARQQHVWQAYLHLNQHLYAFLEQQLAGDALSAADYKVLHPLSEAPGGLLRARELGTEIGWDRSRLSHHLTRMEKRGLIAREECAEDGRGLMVRVTDAGRRAIEAAAPAHAENVQRYFFDQLSNDELDTLAAVFDRLLDNLTRDSTCAP
jgi:DNA-binding MarR family transcriptional regulator